MVTGASMTEKSKLLQMWKIVAWLDEIWQKQPPPKPGPIFNGLSPEGKTLTHWLVYIFDRGRTAEPLWEIDREHLAGLVQTYLEEKQKSVFEILGPLAKTEEDRKVDYVKVDRAKDYAYARFPEDFFAMIRVLYLLDEFDRSLPRYISQNWPACERIQQEGVSGSSPIRCAAFLLYLLTYRNTEKGFGGSIQKEKDLKRVESELERYRDELHRTLENYKNFQTEFVKWFKRRFHKRLWAAVRDVMQESDFLKALSNDEGSLNVLHDLQSAAQSDLELPGDLHNKNFYDHAIRPLLKKLGWERASAPAAIRRAYEELGEPSDLYPVQFDVSFEFDRTACENMRMDVCPFRKDGIEKCRGIADSNCPIALGWMQWSLKCDPASCPVKETSRENLCPGCHSPRKRVCEVLR